MKPLAILGWTLGLGLLWNALGWFGNNLLLGTAWDVVGAQATPAFSPPFEGLSREAMTLVPDFIYAFGFTWLFSQGRTQSLAAAVRLVTVVWLVGACVTYLALVTSGFLPWSIAVQTSLLALLIFVVTAPILPLSRKRTAQPG